MRRCEEKRGNGFIYFLWGIYQREGIAYIEAKKAHNPELLDPPTPTANPERKKEKKGGGSLMGKSKKIYHPFSTDFNRTQKKVLDPASGSTVR